MTVEAFNPGDIFREGVDVDKDELVAALAEINTRLGEAPLAYAAYLIGEVIALADNGRGPAPASDGTVPIRFGRRSLRDFRPEPVEIDANTVITDALHLGCLLRKQTEDAAVLTINPHIDPTVGVFDRFACTLLRYPAAGELKIVSDLANQHPSGHTRVSAGGMATIFVDAVAGVWFFKGDTEA